MKDFTDNLKAFATFVVALFKNGDDENKITAGEFARAHAKKFLAVATVFVIFLAVSCGTSEKFFGVTGEEFMQRYNANLDRYIPGTKYAEWVGSHQRLKVDGVRHLRFRNSDMTFDSLQTRQNYLAMELINSDTGSTVNIHWSLNDMNPAHVVDFRFMSCVAAYSIDGSDDPKRFQETAEVIYALFAQADSGNQSPTITHKGITYSLGPGGGDAGGTLKDYSFWFMAKKSNQ